MSRRVGELRTCMMLALLAVSACGVSRSEPATPPETFPTSREALANTVTAMEAALARTPTDSASAVRLADALLRQARVLNHAGLPLRAESVLDRVIDHSPSDYSARRMRATVYLAQHRFREAILEVGRCRALRGDDAWLDGIAGDASLELGDYANAFAAFDRMVTARPDGPAYARVSYARELQGDLQGALTMMTMAASATSAHDPEAQAWHAAQLGHLHLTAGDLVSARREYSRADHLFPGHPFADTGLARVDVAEGRPTAALQRLTARLATAPSAADFALAGDIYTQLGQFEAAERSYRLAEAGWTSDTPEPAQLARFLATRGWRLDDAVRMAEETFAVRKDIYTADALAWAYFKGGRLKEARAAMAHALSTGSRDPELLTHADAIAAARRTRRP